MTLKTDHLVYCLDDHLHLVCMPYSERALREMAEHLQLMRNWLVSGRWGYYEVPFHRAQEIARMALQVSHEQLIAVIERTLYVA